ncbi:hypothetical protein ONS95_004079 [Cadophora gregata]|uniref:uncharacterized protein n=1 Tax=Cadophora gregata TaxID=51156 RepID=UPI0026DCE7C1|nr:uncharacterized protein ONS95_004079 [Cadophora gregata]KAK0107387.1 hypothetical protein ONS95_004079 [Cadophora gregata]KAK0117067.1 hypothetical protein ONS96_012907 [Cadophora gregata f. sp. sojae]
MAKVPPQVDSFGLHVADRGLNPVLSSSQFSSTCSTTSQPRRQFQSLSSLTTTAINVHDTALRLGLGSPLRIMVETQSSGPVVLTSYLYSPDRCKATIEQPHENSRLLREILDDSNTLEEPIHGLDESAHSHRELGVGEFERRNRPPLLIATVVASSASTIGEARRSAAQLEQTGRDFQSEWSKKLVEHSGAVAAMSGEDS